MPSVDGLTLARTISGDPLLAETRLMVLSSSGDRPSTDEIEDAGILAWLQKPARRHQILEAVARVLDLPTRTGATSHVPAAVPLGAVAVRGDDPSGSRTRLLVAEDNLVNQKVARRFL